MATATLALRRNGRIFGHRHAWQICLTASRPDRSPMTARRGCRSRTGTIPCGCHRGGSPARSGPSTPLTGEWSASPATPRGCGRRQWRQSSCPACGSASGRSEARHAAGHRPRQRRVYPRADQGQHRSHLPADQEPDRGGDRRRRAAGGLGTARHPASPRRRSATCRFRTAGRCTDRADSRTQIAWF